jgi:3-oxoacyl-[acyl-carrier protein] reductase
MKNIAGKTALVTGAASGIGRAIAFALAREGVDLCLLDVDAPGLETLTGQLRGFGRRVLAWQCDLTDRGQLDARLNQLLNEWGGVDIVVNNAGMAYYGPIEAMSDRQWDALLGVNLLAPAHIIRRLLPSLQARGEAQIVNIASIAGLVGFKRIAAYCLTKFGMVGFSESLRCELGKQGIGVTAVCPGFVSTPLFKSTMTANGKQAREPWSGFCMTPEQVAERVVKAIRKNRPLVVLTPLAHLLWRVKRLWPNLLPVLAVGLGSKRRVARLTTVADEPARREAA